MLVLNIPEISFSAGRFLAMVFDKAGLIDELPEDRLDSYEYIKVVIKNNSFECILSKDRSLYEVHWDDDKNVFTGHLINGANKLPIDGDMTEKQMDVLYDIFDNYKTVSKEVKRISMKTVKDEKENLVIIPVFENCTLEDFMTSLMVNDNIAITENKELLIALKRDRARFIVEESERVSSILYRVKGIVPQYMTIKVGDEIIASDNQKLVVTKLSIDGQVQDIIYPGDAADIFLEGNIESITKGDNLKSL